MLYKHIDIKLFIIVGQSLGNIIDINKNIMAMNEQRQRSRPASSTSYRKDYRIPKQEVYNDVRNNVISTFNRRNTPTKQSKSIKQILGPYIHSPSVEKKIDKLLVKYSLSLDFSKKKISSHNDNVDVQFIVKKYIKHRSKVKQEQQASRLLKIQINNFYNTNQKAKEDQFFTFKSQDLKQLETRQKAKNGYANHKSHKHPYMDIYNNTQRQTVAKIQNGQPPQLQTDLVSYSQPEQWQKSHKKFRSTYSGIKTMRMRQKGKSKKQYKYQFYLS